MESDFDWLAKPARQKLFKVIPYKRPSSSFGYSQAIKGTWKQYKDETGNKYALRTRFKDSVDFIGWYTNKTEKIEQPSAVFCGIDEQVVKNNRPKNKKYFLKRITV